MGEGTGDRVGTGAYPVLSKEKSNGILILDK